MSSNRDKLISIILKKRENSHQLDKLVATLENEKETLEEKLTAVVKISIKENNKLYGGHNDGK